MFIPSFECLAQRGRRCQRRKRQGTGEQSAQKQEMRPCAEPAHGRQPGLGPRPRADEADAHAHAVPGTAVRLVRVALAVGDTMGLAACGTMHVDTAPTADDERVYDALHPYYAELCALSQFKKKPGFGAPVSSGFGDGIGGHSGLYLNGVCRVADAHYPTVKLCDADEGAAGRRLRRGGARAGGDAGSVVG